MNEYYLEEEACRYCGERYCVDELYSGLCQECWEGPDD